MSIKKTLIVLNIAGLLGSLFWLMTDKGIEPLIACIGLISALIAQLYSKSKNAGSVKMTQKGGKGSKNYQSKGDININKVK